jgi:GMP synthase (glutamine-hydrolysing)
MTKTLVVNCSLKTKSEALVEAVGKFSECRVVNFGEVERDFHFEPSVDAVVISGSAARIVTPADRDMFRGVGNLIRNCELPILGICYGHQLLCWTFGAKVGSLNKPALECFERVHVTKTDVLFSGFEKADGIPLSENHYDYVLKDGLSEAGFLLLADSASCEVEAVRHGSKPFYGVQFHPERVTVKGKTHVEGHKVIENFFSNVVKR